MIVRRLPDVTGPDDPGSVDQEQAMLGSGAVASVIAEGAMMLVHQQREAILALDAQPLERFPALGDRPAADRHDLGIETLRAARTSSRSRWPQWTHWIPRKNTSTTLPWRDPVRPRLTPSASRNLSGEAGIAVAVNLVAGGLRSLQRNCDGKGRPCWVNTSGTIMPWSSWSWNGCGLSCSRFGSVVWGGILMVHSSVVPSASEIGS